jgi:hypothetical protein
MKPTALIIYFLLLTVSGYAQKQISGTIYFADSSSQPFVNLEYIKYFYNKNEIEATQSKVLKVSIDKREKKIKSSEIDKIKLIYFEINEGEDYLRNAIIEVTTKTGETFQGKYKFFDSVTVLLLDDITGKDQQQQFKFGLNGQLYIKEIKFN